MPHPRRRLPRTAIEDAPHPQPPMEEPLMRFRSLATAIITGALATGLLAAPAAAGAAGTVVPEALTTPPCSW